jgi:hypothetical protein
VIVYLRQDRIRCLLSNSFEERFSLTTTISYINLILQIVTSFAIFFAAWQIMFHARQMHRDLETVYVQQYWKIVAQTTLSWRQTYFSTVPKSEKDLFAVLQYLQLCEDEIDLRRRARVTDSTWEIWAQAIAGTMKKPAFVQAFSKSPSGYFSELAQMLQAPDPAKYDPLERSRIWRRVHGL